ncbi:MAG: hypothetical protein O3A14_09900 [Cyanobacteria bacterium]|nr:hypothetical protein [Cyanobacteriota bacterium]
MSFKQIPIEYTYHDIEEVENKSKAAKLALDQLIAFSAEGRNEFTSEDVAQEIYGFPEAWEILAPSKKTRIKNAVNSAIRRFKRERGSKVLDKTEAEAGAKVTWEIKVSPKTFAGAVSTQIGDLLRESELED